MTFHLLIIDILYIIEDTNIPINSGVVMAIIKSMYIFNDVCLTSKPHIIKASPKSDIVVIWMDIWNTQSGTKAKGLINKCFNISNYITIIYRTNMNLRVPQYKNC